MILAHLTSSLFIITDKAAIIRSPDDVFLNTETNLSNTAKRETTELTASNLV